MPSRRAPQRSRASAAGEDPTAGRAPATRSRRAGWFPPQRGSPSTSGRDPRRCRPARRFPRAPDTRVRRAHTAPPMRRRRIPPRPAVARVTRATPTATPGVAADRLRPRFERPAYWSRCRPPRCGRQARQRPDPPEERRQPGVSRHGRVDASPRVRQIAGPDMVRRHIAGGMVDARHDQRDESQRKDRTHRADGRAGLANARASVRYSCSPDDVGPSVVTCGARRGRAVKAFASAH